MIHKVFMPRFGQTMEEGTIEGWAKEIGDAVSPGDVILEITTDKATLEVEAFVEGVLRKTLAEKGDTVKVGRLIALVGDPDEELPDVSSDEMAPQAAAQAPAEQPAPATPALAASASTPAAPAPTPAIASPPVVAAPPERVFASPRARRRAEDELLCINVMAGTGPQGRIVEQDVVDYAAKVAERKVTPVAKAIAFERGIDLLAIQPSGGDGRITKEDVLAAAPAGADRVEPLSAMRRVVAQRMLQSKQQVPHYYLMMDMDMTEAVAYRAELNAPGDVKVSFNDLLIKACATAFKDSPDMLATWAGDSVVHKARINVGLAVALDDGLIVPVVKDVDKKDIKQIATESRALIDKARSKRLTPDEYEDGRLTISNLGMMDVDCFIPIINPGEAAILGVGRIAEKVVVIDGGIHVRKMMTVTLSGDHRVIDGAIGATFLQQVKMQMEDPRQIA